MTEVFTMVLVLALILWFVVILPFVAAILLLWARGDAE